MEGPARGVDVEGQDAAFLEQLRRVTPEGVKLQTVTVQPAQLSISGSSGPSSMAGGFEQINAFALNLESLAAIPIDGAAIQKAETSNAASTAFSLRVRVDPAIKPTPQQLPHSLFQPAGAWKTKAKQVRVGGRDRRAHAVMARLTDVGRVESTDPEEDLANCRISCG